MKYFTLILTSLILISCNRGISDSLHQPQQLDGSWELVSMSGTDIQIDPEEDGIENPKLDIQADEMKYAGNDGCNSFMGGLTELDGEHLSFGLAAGTKMMCKEMEIPDQFMRTLGQVKSYKIKNQTLKLYEANGEELMQLKSTH